MARTTRRSGKGVRTDCARSVDKIRQDTQSRRQRVLASAVLCEVLEQRRLLSWSMHGAADFNADEKPDVIWRDEGAGATGAVRIQFMSGSGGITLESTVELLGSPAVEWNLVGAGDFNADSHPDLFWHKPSTGQTSIWLMNGTTVTSTTSVGTPAVAWEAVAVGDFDGDGKSDLLWHNSSTSSLNRWKMNGTTVVSTANLSASRTYATWEVVGTGDFNTSDAKADIVWRQRATPYANDVWLMNDASVTSTLNLTQDGTPISVNNSNYRIGGTGKLNSDAHSDILWYGPTNTAWYMNGGVRTGSAAMPSAPTVLSPAAPTGFTATAVDHARIDLAWNIAVSPATFYIECQENGTGTWIPVDTQPISGALRSFSDTAVAADRSYSYRIRATNAGGHSGYATAVGVTPAQLSATATSASAITLTWSNASGESGYVLERSISADFTAGTVTAFNLAADTTSYQDDSLEETTRYYYRVQALGLPATPPWAFADATTPYAIPTIATAPASAVHAEPTKLNLSALGNTQRGESFLTYHWSVVAKPTGADDPLFSANATNAAKNSVATFAKSGSYTLRLEIHNGDQSVGQDFNVSVQSATASVEVTPATTTLNLQGTQQFTAAAVDQFGDTLPVTWSIVTGGGSIDQTGLYTAPATAGSATVRATADGLYDEAAVTITNNGPIIIVMSVNEDATLAFAAADFMNAFSDGDPGNTLAKILIETLPAHGG